ncbi:hypothetical protein V8F06_013153 [Rhypophila decipiens]
MCIPANRNSTPGRNNNNRTPGPVRIGAGISKRSNSPRALEKGVLENPVYIIAAPTQHSQPPAFLHPDSAPGPSSIFHPTFSSSTIAVTESVNEAPSSDTQQQHRHRLPVDQPARPRGSTTSVTDSVNSANGVNQPLSSATQQELQQVRRLLFRLAARPPRPTRRLEPRAWTALQSAETSEAAREDPANMNVLYQAFNDLWLNILAEPDTFMMSDQEYCLFLFFEYLYREIPIARHIAMGAGARYWGSNPGRVGPLATAPGSSR